jgi:hypothetical protein
LVLLLFLAGAVVGVGVAAITSRGDRTDRELFCYADAWLGADGESWQRGDGCRWVDANGNVIPGQPDPRCLTQDAVVVSCDDDDARQQTGDAAVLGERG